MSDELIDRFLSALDSPEGVEGDPELRDLLDGSPEVRGAAQELARIDAALKSWPGPDRSERGWEALAARVEQRLDEALPALDRDATAPPQFDDEDAAVAERLSAERISLSELEGIDDPASPAPAMSTTPPPLPFSTDLLAKTATPSATEPPPPPPPPPADARSVRASAPKKPSNDDSDLFSLKNLGELDADSPIGQGEEEVQLLSTDLLESEPPPEPVLKSTPVAKGERFSLPSVPPPPVPEFITMPPPKRGDEAKGAFRWVAGGFAAAATLIMVFVFGTMSSSGVEEVAQAPALEGRDQGDATGFLEPPAEPAAVPADPAPEPTRSQDNGNAAPEGPAAGGALPLEEPPTRRAELDDDVPSPRAAPSPQRRGSAVSPPVAEMPAEAPRSGLEDGTRAAPAAPTRAAPGPAGSSAGELRPPEQSRPSQPSREAILAALQGVAGAVAGCGGGARSGVARVVVRFHSSGRVQTALVTGSFAGTPEGSCIARAVRSARVPPFSQPNFEVQYPFRVP